jgi:hypothetical protein
MRVPLIVGGKALQPADGHGLPLLSQDAELLALVLLIAIAYGLFRIIPDLAEFAISLFDLYRDEIRRIAGKDK